MPNKGSLRVEKERRRVMAAILNFHRSSVLQRCLAPNENCSESVIRAHSIQGSAILDRLAHDGHIYMFKHNIDGKIQLAKEGRNRASTFTGLCQFHDSELFREVDFDDTRTFNPESKRQLALLSLRAVAREYWAKLNAQKFSKHLLNLTNKRDVAAIKQLLNLPSLYSAKICINNTNNIFSVFPVETQQAISRLQKLYLSLHTQVQNNKFHLLRDRSFIIDGDITFAVASAFAPEFDLEGRQLNTLHLGTDPTDVVLNIIPSGSKTYVLFTFHKRHAAVLSPFFDQMEALRDLELKQVISKMVVMHCENAVLAPRMVDALTINQRSELEKLFHETMFVALPYNQVADVLLF